MVMYRMSAYIFCSSILYVSELINGSLVFTKANKPNILAMDFQIFNVCILQGFLFSSMLGMVGMGGISYSILKPHSNLFSELLVKGV